MPDTMKSIELFMTEADEEAFSTSIKKQIGSVRFIDDFSWESPIVQYRESLASCGPHAAILCTDIVPLNSFETTMIAPHPSGVGFIPGTIGKGLIQFQSSCMADYNKDCLKNGRLAASYNSTGDPETAAFVTAVWKAFKTNAIKVNLIDIKSGEILNKPEARFFAWPDAASNYDGTNRNYLSNHAMAYFVPCLK